MHQAKPWLSQALAHFLTGRAAGESLSEACGVAKGISNKGLGREIRES